MRHFEQAEEHVQPITQYFKKLLLAGQSLVEPQLSRTMIHSTHSFFKKTTG
jgi:hypothetical protein